jgi:5-methylcytosine-specific restriction endonuclease McrA
MLVEDKAAFIEQFEVLVVDSRARRRGRSLRRAELEVMRREAEARVADDALWRLGSQLAIARELEDARGERALVREIDMVRGRLSSARQKLRDSRARLERLELHAPDDDAPRARVFRLHSDRHYLECSEHRFSRLAALQLDRPVLVMKREGRRWWWYLDRFWWDELGRSPSEVAALVGHADLRRREQSEERARTTAALLGDDPPCLRDEDLSPIVRFAVWCRDRGRCVDCRSTEGLGYEQIVPFSKAGLRWIANVELRCARCRDQRALNTARTEVSRARIESSAFVR